MEVFKGAVLNIKFGPFYVFSRVFFTPLRYDYPSDVTLVLWQYESRIRGGLLYYNLSKKGVTTPNTQWNRPCFLFSKLLASLINNFVDIFGEFVFSLLIL